MPDYKYVIAGGGMAASAAIQGIREVDPHGKIGLIGTEPYPPYDRPPLSKGLWKGMPEKRIWRKFKADGVTLHLGRTVRAIDPWAKRVIDDQGTGYPYEKLLLATGGTPRRLPFGGEDVIYYRTFADYRQLRSLCEHGQAFVVIGGGFIGAETAAALALQGKAVSLIFPEAGICHRILPRDLSAHLNDYYREHKVEVMAGEAVVDIERRSGSLSLKLKSGRYLSVDGIVAGLGLEPNIAIAKSAALTTENGVVVDEYLRTSHPDIYAAGDVAMFYSPALRERLRVEHEDNAIQMGLLAGRNMAGQSQSYEHLPYFYSDLFDLGFEAVGKLDNRYTTVADWQEPFRTGVVYYLQASRVCGVLLWNVWDKVDAARELIAASGPVQAGDLIGRIKP